MVGQQAASICFACPRPGVSTWHLPSQWMPRPINSVAVIQSIVRSPVFKESETPQESEVAKTQPLSEEDLTVIYLGSYAIS